MIYIIHKMLVLLKNHLNYLQEKVFFLRSMTDFYFFKKKQFFWQHIVMENPRPEEENIISDLRNLFRLKQELNYTAIKDIRNPLD